MASSSEEDDPTYDDYQWDLQPVDETTGNLLGIVFRPLEFNALASIGRSPNLVVIHGGHDVSFRVCYGGDDDDFDSVFGSFLEPRHLKNFCAWLRDASGASASSTAVRLPRPLCRSAREWEVVEPELEEFFAMEVDPSEEDRALVFGSASSSSVAPPQQNAVVPSRLSSAAVAASLLQRCIRPFSSPATLPPAPLPVQSLSPSKISSKASSSNAVAATAASPLPAPSKSVHKQIRDARAHKYFENLKRKRQEKRAARAASTVVPAASSPSSSAAPPPPPSRPPPAAVSERFGDAGNFKYPKVPKAKSVVVAPKPSTPSFPSASTSTLPSTSKRASPNFVGLPSSSVSFSKESRASSSSSSEPSSKRSRTESYELKKQLLRQHETTTKILSLLDLPAGIVTPEQEADMYSKATRKFESRMQSSSPSCSTNSSHRSRSPIPSSSRRRSPSPSTSRSGSVKDRLGIKSNASGSTSGSTSVSTSGSRESRVAGNSSSSRMYSVANPPPQSNFRCVDVRYSRGEVGGYTEKADTTDRTSPKSSNEGRGKGSKRQRKGKGKGKKNDDRNKK